MRIFEIKATWDFTFQEWRVLVHGNETVEEAEEKVESSQVWRFKTTDLPSVLKNIHGFCEREGAYKREL